jgi:hypothetical protein
MNTVKEIHSQHQEQEQQKYKFYRGYRIYENISDFGTPYYSIVNPRVRRKDDPLHKSHVHVNTIKAAYEVINCACGKFNKSRYIRTKATELKTGITVKRR